MKKTMQLERKSHVKNSMARVIFVLISMILQVAWIVLTISVLKYRIPVLQYVFRVMAILVAVRIYGKNENAAFKTPWMVLMLILPVLGLCLYAMFGNKRGMRKIRKKFTAVSDAFQSMIPQEQAVMDALENRDPSIANQCRYIRDFGAYPVYQNTDAVFYANASLAFEAQLQDLANAKQFIFLEYHAIQEAEIFSLLKPILAERAAAGVEVRIFYDNVGSIGFIDTGFIGRMESIGVKCRRFNPLVPVLNVFMNNRDHRKITVIDGKIGYTGGYNLADEYFNLTHPYGEWRDTGIRLEGDAVNSLTIMFLEMWNAMDATDSKEASAGYLRHQEYRAKEKSFVQPYGDTPLDDEAVGENIYMNLIKNAKHYLWLTTPYLIITDEINRELCLAAQRGVDVRIVTPGIPDKKLVYRVTRSYYARLVQKGVRIYEYKPGFLHAKQVICDDEIGTVGTVNFDYRSLYHHFEDGVLLYQCDSTLKSIKGDFAELFSLSAEVTEKYWHQSAVLRLAQCILRLFAPLM
ncbi:MAG: cardiolipin synthase [Clostridiales bacterium]|nr:cardiolipin synthase [Clostridiales bacterium]